MVFYLKRDSGSIGQQSVKDRRCYEVNVLGATVLVSIGLVIGVCLSARYFSS